MSKAEKSILIVAPSWVGDMVMAQSLFKAIKEEDPEVAIDVLAPAWTRALVSRMPEIRASIDMPLGHGQLGLIKRYKIGKSLRGKRYNQAIVLPGSLKSAFVPFWAKIPKRTGFVGECRYKLLNDIRKLDKELLSMTVQRFVSLAYSSSNEIPDVRIPALTSDKQNGLNVLKLNGFDGDSDRIICICPGAEYGVAKRWPAEHYGALAKKLAESGWKTVIAGSEKDSNVATEVNRISGDICIDLSGKTSLSEVIDVLSVAAAVVSNDSGLMHVAAALDKNLVAIYGSSDPQFTPPLNKKSRILNLGLACSPCMERECRYKHLKCLVNISPQIVFAELGSLIEI